MLLPAPHHLHIPPRPKAAVDGVQFMRQIENCPLQEREAQIERQIEIGNVPEFQKTLVPVPLHAVVDGKTITGTIFVTPDYLSIGSNADYQEVPMTPFTAQRVANRTRSMLPTPKMVDAIYLAAQVKLAPTPIPPSDAMTTVAVFEAHNQMVLAQRAQVFQPLGALVAGTQKDVVICSGLATNQGHVAIYGWHMLDAKPIQPLYLGHIASWADYSHGVRFVDRMMEVDGKCVSVDKILADPKLSALVSSEGPVRQTRYVFKSFPTASANP